MKTYLIVVESKAGEAIAGRIIFYVAEPLRIVHGIDGPDSARETMREHMKRVREGKETRTPAVFVLYPEDGLGWFRAPSHWFDPETLATIDPAGWLIATGRLERLGPNEVRKKPKSTVSSSEKRENDHNAKG